MTPRVALALAALVTGASIAGCGAKTGLDVPDSSMDATIDAPTDAGLDAPPCIELIPDGGLLELPLETEVQLNRADVVFLIDTTGSMGQEIAEIRRTLRDQIIPGIRTSIPDSNVGVATFADFPVRPCGEPTMDTPFQLVLPTTSDAARVQSAVDAITLGNGGDPPESQVEALFQVATGAGISPFVAPSLGCPMGGVGFPCFRTDSVPVVMLFTDAPFHNGPGGSNPYTACPIGAVPHTYAQAIDALDALGVRVMGLFSGGRDGLDDLRQLARDTGAVSGGEPIVFDIGMMGERLSTSVIAAIESLAGAIEFDIDTFMVDVDTTDGVDPRDFVLGIVPVRATPMSGIREIDVAAGAFRGVRTGTSVVFQVVLDPAAMAPGPGPHRYFIEVVFRGDGRARLDSRIIEIILPGSGESCDGGVRMLPGALPVR